MTEPHFRLAHQCHAGTFTLPYLALWFLLLSAIYCVLSSNLCLWSVIQCLFSVAFPTLVHLLCSVLLAFQVDNLDFPKFAVCGS